MPEEGSLTRIMADQQKYISGLQKGDVGLDIPKLDDIKQQELQQGR